MYVIISQETDTESLMKDKTETRHLIVLNMTQVTKPFVLCCPLEKNNE